MADVPVQQLVTDGMAGSNSWGSLPGYVGTLCDHCVNNDQTCKPVPVVCFRGCAVLVLRLLLSSCCSLLLGWGLAQIWLRWHACMHTYVCVFVLSAGHLAE